MNSREPNLFQELNLHGTEVPSPAQLRQLFDKYSVQGALGEPELRLLLTHVYHCMIEDVRLSGVSESYYHKAHLMLESEWGRTVIQEGVSEILRLRDVNRNGKLEWEEFCGALQGAPTSSKKHSRGQSWRLAPSCEISIDMDRFVNGPHHRLKVFVCGGVAGCCAKTVSSPLARLTILLQTGGLEVKKAGTSLQIRGVGPVVRHVLRTEGLRGLFRGNAADILRTIPYSAILYLTYETWKRNTVAYDPSKSKIGARMLSGGMAGATAILATYPLDLVRARLCVQTTDYYKGIFHALGRIRREEGMFALYRGALVACAERFPNMAVNYACYDIVRNALDARGYVGITASLSCGAIAGLVSSLVTFPVDLTMRNLQVDGREGAKRKYSGALSCVRHVLATDGVRGMYAGLGPQLAKGLPYTCVAWAAYDQMRKVLDLQVR